MAGETPGASDTNRRRRRLQPGNTSADKAYYASGQASVFPVSPGGDRSRNKPRGVPTPVVRADDKSANKYYAVGGSDRGRITKALGPPPKLRAVGARAADVPPSGPLLADSPENVNRTVDAVVTRLHAGEEVVVLVPAGASDLLKRTRAALDGRVTRADISEDQYGRVRIAYAPSPAVAPADATAAPATLGDPTPAAAKVEIPESEVVGKDPLDFLNSDFVEPALDTSPAAVTEVVGDDDCDYDSSPADAETPPHAETPATETAADVPAADVPAAETVAAETVAAETVAAETAATETTPAESASPEAVPTGRRRNRR